MAVTYTVRTATATNNIGHSYTTASGGTYTASRWYTSVDLSAWNEASSGTWNGPTADGTIALGWLEGDATPGLQDS